MVELKEIRGSKRRKKETPVEEDIDNRRSDEDVYDDHVKQQINDYLYEEADEEPAPPPAPKQKSSTVRKPAPARKQVSPPPEPEPEYDDEPDITAEDLVKMLNQIEAKVDAVGNICAALYKIITTPIQEPVIRQQVDPQQPIRVNRKERPVEPQEKKKGLSRFFSR